MIIALLLQWVNGDEWVKKLKWYKQLIIGLSDGCLVGLMIYTILMIIRKLPELKIHM